MQLVSIGDGFPIPLVLAYLDVYSYSSLSWIISSTMDAILNNAECKYQFYIALLKIFTALITTLNYAGCTYMM